MAREIIHVDINNSPDILRLAEEVAKSGKPRVLRRDSEDIAVVLPVRRASKRGRGRVKTEADWEAFRSSTGSWKDNVDVDRFLKDIDQGRRLTRPPVEL